MENVSLIAELQERLAELEEEMNKVSTELICKINDKKIRAIKRLSLKLHEVSSEVIKVNEQIVKLEKQANTKVIKDGAYTISLLDNERAQIEKSDGTLILDYIYLENILVGNEVYSSFKRSNGKVNSTEIYELGLNWAQRKGTISKHARAEIALAEEVLNRYIGFVGGSQIV